MLDIITRISLVTHVGDDLPSDSMDLECYQFCYVTSTSQIIGASRPFQIKNCSITNSNKSSCDNSKESVKHVLNLHYLHILTFQNLGFWMFFLNHCNNPLTLFIQNIASVLLQPSSLCKVLLIPLSNRSYSLSRTITYQQFTHESRASVNIGYKFSIAEAQHQSGILKQLRTHRWMV